MFAKVYSDNMVVILYVTPNGQYIRKVEATLDTTQMKTCLMMQCVTYFNVDEYPELSLIAKFDIRTKYLFVFLPFYLTTTLNICNRSRPLCLILSNFLWLFEYLLPHIIVKESHRLKSSVRVVWKTWWLAHSKLIQHQKRIQVPQLEIKYVPYNINYKDH